MGGLDGDVHRQEDRMSEEDPWGKKKITDATERDILVGKNEIRAISTDVYSVSRGLEC